MRIMLYLLGVTISVPAISLSVASARIEFRQPPVSFEPNNGQTSPDVRFLARGFHSTMHLRPGELVISGTPGADPGASREAAARRKRAPRSEVRIELAGSLVGAAMSGLEPLHARSHYLYGADPSRWITNVPHFARVEAKDVYPGVDLIVSSVADGIEYDFIVQPGADAAQIRLQVSGAGELELQQDGSIVGRKGRAVLLHNAPVVYQEGVGERTAVAGRFILKGRREFGFELGPYDRSRPLVIDPVVVYSTYIGGSGIDEDAAATFVDVADNTYVVGRTSSIDFPTTSGSLQTSHAGGQWDAYLVKLSPGGDTVVYATYFGGSSGDWGTGVYVDDEGAAYVSGSTQSANFPVTPGAFQTTYRGGNDAFLLKFAPSGSALFYSTLIGGGALDEGAVVAADASGNAFLSGWTKNPTGFPVTPGAFQTSYGGGQEDSYLLKLNPAGSALVYSTYIGGTGSKETGLGLAVDPEGNVYLTGATSSPNFPTTPGAFDRTHNGGDDAYLIKLNPSGSALVFGTYLGAGGGEEGVDVVVDDTGASYIAGWTTSTSFPIRDAVQAVHGGMFDAFVTKVDPAGSALLYSTFLGGSNWDYGLGIALDCEKNIYVAGFTQEPGTFPIVNAIQPVRNGWRDAFVAKLAPSGAPILYSTYFGGSAGEEGNDVATDRFGDAFVVGRTNSTNLPVVHAFQPTSGGGYDGFAARIAESVDGDGDGHREPGGPPCPPDLPKDCNDGDSAVWTTPGEVRDLRFQWDRETLVWEMPIEMGGIPTSASYDTLRSPDPAEFVSDAVCIESGDGTDRLAMDRDTPLAGSLFAYLIRAVNACPLGQGSLGRDSNGTERVGISCP